MGPFTRAALDWKHDEALRAYLPPVIGLHGLAGAGKSAVAEYLVVRGYEVVKFAGPLKEMMRALLRTIGTPADTIERMIEGDLKEKPTALLGGRSPRHAMQTLGGDWGREMMTESFWTGLTQATIRERQRHGAVVVVDDLRYENEAETLKALGAKLWKVDRPGALGETYEHPSEAGLPNHMFDTVFPNVGTKEDLASLVEAELSRLVSLAQFSFDVV